MTIQPGDHVTYYSRIGVPSVGKVITISKNGQWLFVKYESPTVYKLDEYDQVHIDAAKLYDEPATDIPNS